MTNNSKSKNGVISHKSKVISENGFTLIELLVAFGILIIVSSVGFISLSRYKGGQDIELSMEEIISAIRDVQKRSITEQDGLEWGIRFDNASSSYEIWSGSSYASGTVDRLYSLKRNTVFGNPSTSTVDTIFSAISGKLSENRILSIFNTKKDGIVGDVVMTERGTVTSRLEHGLAGYWHFDEATSTVAYDTSGIGNNGTLTGSPTWQTSSECKTGECLSFNGTTGYVSAGTSVPDVESAYTISMWVYATAKGGLFSRSVGSGWLDERLVLHQYSSNKLRLTHSNGSAYNTVDSSADFPLNQWVHVAVTWDGSSANFYFDGALDVTRALTRATEHSGVKTWIGRVEGLGSNYFTGKIDEVRVYNRALSATEILNLYDDLK